VVFSCDSTPDALPKPELQLNFICRRPRKLPSYMSRGKRPHPDIFSLVFSPRANSYVSPFQQDFQVASFRYPMTSSADHPSRISSGQALERQDTYEMVWQVYSSGTPSKQSEDLCAQQHHILAGPATCDSRWSLIVY
jgi:hypothetical protein